MPVRRSRYSSAQRSPPQLAPRAPATPGLRVRAASWVQRYQGRLSWLALAGLAALLAANLWRSPAAPAARLSQKELDTAIAYTLQTQPMLLSAAAANAADAIAASVVRVQGLRKNEQGEEEEHGIGTGVVIVNVGVILTNLHVVLGAERVRVTFFDGSESEAFVSAMQPEDDLAVLQARTIPDDLPAAPLRSTQGLRPGDAVVAVGFPFGIGPSVSAGVVSGLRRAFTSPEGKRELQNLIQFDAAANPGNSGGPLITLEGEVVGIVTAILNPNKARTFVGVGFAVPIENAAAAAGSSPF